MVKVKNGQPEIQSALTDLGLSCHKCYFSWKLVFQHEDNRFEIVLSASSANEERLWKTGLLKSVAASADVQRPVSSEQSKFCFLSLNLQPLDSPCYTESFIAGRSFIWLVLSFSHLKEAIPGVYAIIYLRNHRYNHPEH